jgi:hypothetical protein
MPAAAGLALVCEYEDAANANSVVSETKQFLVPNMRQTPYLSSAKQFFN